MSGFPKIIFDVFMGDTVKTITSSQLEPRLGVIGLGSSVALCFTPTMLDRVELTMKLGKHDANMSMHGYANNTPAWSFHP